MGCDHFRSVQLTRPKGFDLQLRLRLLGFRLGGLWRFFLGLDGEQFHFKNEGGIGRNIRPQRRAGRRQARRERKAPTWNQPHELQGFGPTLDHLANRKCRGLPAFVRTIEFLAVEKVTFIVALDSVGSCGLWPRAWR